MVNFEPSEYHSPTIISEAIQMLREYGNKSRIIAGGTDLLVEKPANVQCLIDIKRLNLNYIKREKGYIKI
jgi:CO/xanthine dehydrogenase FAD-binding subunit